jgi:L-threonylcarbamoyladenylate synthase
LGTSIVAAIEANIQRAAELVKKGCLVVYPTETVYGLGCDPYNTAAVKRLLETKRREEKPLPLLVNNLAQAEKLAVFNVTSRRVADRFWPGPLTLILRRQEGGPTGLGGDPSLIGVRIPDHKVALRLIELSGGCLTGTSANLTGKAPPATAEDALKQLGGKVDLILDGGRVKLGVSSTVLNLSDLKPKILRVGSIKAAELSGFLNVDVEGG